MLSVRLPQDLDHQLQTYCESQHLQRSQVVQIALRNHLNTVQQTSAANDDDPFWSWAGKGRGNFTTDEWMRVSRGDDWNKP